MCAPAETPADDAVVWAWAPSHSDRRPAPALCPSEEDAATGAPWKCVAVEPRRMGGLQSCALIEAAPPHVITSDQQQRCGLGAASSLMPQHRRPWGGIRGIRAASTEGAGRQVRGAAGAGRRQRRISCAARAPRRRRPARRRTARSHSQAPAGRRPRRRSAASPPVPAGWPSAAQPAPSRASWRERPW